MHSPTNSRDLKQFSQFCFSTFYSEAEEKNISVSPDAGKMCKFLVPSSETNYKKSNRIRGKRVARKKRTSQAVFSLHSLPKKHNSAGALGGVREKTLLN